MSELCVPGCRYRALYEGSQTSLADMAAKQAQAVTEHQTLRAELAKVFKRYFPREFQAAERAMGQRFDATSDDLLIGYLDEVLAVRHLGESIEVLRAALRAAGLDVGAGDDLTEWAAQIAALHTAGQPTAPAHPAPAAVPAVPAAPAAPVGFAMPEPVGPWDPAPSAQPADELPSEAAVHGLLAELGLGTPASGEVDRTHRAPSSGGPAPHDLDDLGSLDGLDDLDALDELGTLDDLDDLFAEPTPSPAVSTALADALDAPRDAVSTRPQDDPQDGTVVPDPEPDAVSDGRDAPAALADLFAPTPAGSGGLADLFAPQPTAPDAGSGPASAAPAPAPPAAALDAEASGGAAPAALADLFAPVAMGAPTPGLAPAVPATPITPAPASNGATRSMPLPLKPEVVTATGRRKPGRAAPKPRAPRSDVPENAPAGELEDATRQALLAAVALPRPSFVADLAQVAGSREVVEDWEAELRELRSGSPVRFIGGKSRYRQRGSLVIPHGALRQAAERAPAPWWAECLTEYRGAKLYELAVLLHRIGPELISWEFGPDVAMLRANDRRGLVGLAVVLHNDLGEGGQSRRALEEALGVLVRERLGAIAVLATHHEWEPALCQLVPELARQHGWSPSAPIVYAHSWEWADDAGATAKLLISG